MDITDYAFTKTSIKDRVYSLYLMGHSVEEIFAATGFKICLINNIIDCKNYLEA